MYKIISKKLFEDNNIFPEHVRYVISVKFGNQSYIKTEVWLPKKWNNIFVGLGNGGMAGKIDYAALSTYIKKGYAVSNTDLGTSFGRKFGINNPDVWKDFGWRATSSMMEISKELIFKHYGSDAKYSYFIGSSTGGQQALAMAQKFPSYYDGIIAGVPANNRTMLHTYFLWNHNHLRINDKPLFSKKEIINISNLAVNYFNKIGDGEKGDKFITFPRNDEYTITDFLNYLKLNLNSITEIKLNSLKSIYNGPINPIIGERIYNGMPIGSEMYGCGIEECQRKESPHFYPFIWTFGKDYIGANFDFNKDLDMLNAKLSDDLNANNPDLSEFNKNGGKLIMYSGSADPCVPFPDAMNYYKEFQKKMGGIDKISNFFRYFLFPGKSHAFDGMGVNKIWCDETKEDEFKALRLWREKGISPDYLIGVGYNNQNPLEGINFTRKIKYFKGENDYPLSCSEIYLK